MGAQIVFKPDNIEITAEAGETLLQTAARAGIILRGACGGIGTCGRCRVIILDGEARSGDELYHGGDRSAVAACKTYPVSDLVVEIPAASRFTEHRVLIEEQQKGGLRADDDTLVSPDGPLYREISIQLAPPGKEDPEDDLGRLRRAAEPQLAGRELTFSPRIMRDLPAGLRTLDWRLRCGVAYGYETPRLIDIGPRRSRAGLGLAVDLGTTTVVAQLVDLGTGAVIGTCGTYNRQAAFGDDVISRIVYASEEPDGRKHLHVKALETINELLDELASECGMDKQNVKCCACAGNPTMIHLLLGVDPAYIRLEPYVPAANAWPVFPAVETGIEIFPDAPVYCLPGVASYIGGDISGGLAVSGAAVADKVTLFADIGTNGEIVLGNREWLIGCACSAGPSFEGVGVACGTRASEGAVERVSVSRGGFEVLAGTVGKVKPVGVCGSGLISALSSLLRAGVIDRSGRFITGLDTPRVRSGVDGPEFVLVWGPDSGTGRDIVLTAGDIQNLLRAKAAVFAGIRSLMKSVGIDQNDVDRILIAGGFGRHLNISDAVAIGMLPDLPPERFRFVGNSSLGGARLALLSETGRSTIEATARRVTYMELDETTPFMDEFMAAMFIPHTDIGLFPSAVEQE